MQQHSPFNPAIQYRAPARPAAVPYRSIFPNSRKIQLVILHIFFGVIFSQAFNYLHFYAYGLLLYAVYKTVQTNNRTGIGHFFVGYIASMEVYFRMIKTPIVWQYGKYSLILILLFGMLVEKKKKTVNQAYVFYLLMLFPSIIIIDTTELFRPLHQILSAALSGPLTLALSTLYFLKRTFSLEEIKDFLFVLALGLVPCLAFLFKHITSLGNMEFSEHSNLSTSAGFGPNQVSTALGIGLIIVFLAKLFDLKLFINRYVDWFFAALTFTLGILTFSRGGTLSALIAMTCAYAAAQLDFKSKIKFHKTFFLGIIAVLVMYQLFRTVDSYTGGALYNRYTQSESESTTKFATGRDKIIMADLKIFLDNPLFGIGPGMAYTERKKYGTSKNVTSHTEFTRLLSEHGVFGIISLIILLLYPVYYFLKMRNSRNKLIFLIMIVYSLLTMGHSSMRLAIVGLLYGMAFISIRTDQNNEKRVLYRKFPPPR